MFNEIKYSVTDRFDSSEKVKVPDMVDENTLVIPLQEDRIAFRNGQDGLYLLKYSDALHLGFDKSRMLYSGTYGSVKCYSVELEKTLEIPPSITTVPLRQVISRYTDDLPRMLCYAKQIIDWDNNHLFCSKCNSKLEYKDNERAKYCKTCNSNYFPKISPAIIVSIIDEDKILLARNRYMPTNFYSVQAGFVEPGENLEECVKREIHEEVGVDITDIRYVASQCWPFSNSLMIGFTARYLSGQINVDGNEIVEAKWFNRENVPEFPGPGSIAHTLITNFISEKSRSGEVS